LNPERAKPLGTTASGGYQMVKRTWEMARDALALPDFTPASQDAGAIWILKFKVPGTWNVNANGTGIYDMVAAGRFDEATRALAPEWESFAKMHAGKYPMTLADAQQIYESAGGTVA
jgi:lysozyme